MFFTINLNKKTNHYFNSSYPIFMTNKSLQFYLDTFDTIKTQFFGLTVEIELGWRTSVESVNDSILDPSTFKYYWDPELGSDHSDDGYLTWWEGNIQYEKDIWYARDDLEFLRGVGNNISWVFMGGFHYSLREVTSLSIYVSQIIFLDSNLDFICLGLKYSQRIR